MTGREVAVSNPFTNNGFQVNFHKYATFVWIALTIPTLLIWKDSILWVALMSVWANIAAHWSAFQAASAEKAAEQDEQERTRRNRRPDIHPHWG